MFFLQGGCSEDSDGIDDTPRHSGPTRDEPMNPACDENEGDLKACCWMSVELDTCKDSAGLDPVDNVGPSLSANY